MEQDVLETKKPISPEEAKELPFELAADGTLQDKEFSDAPEGN